MDTAVKAETFVHPELGELPARRLLDCVFVLAASGRILHFHAEQTTIETTDAAVRYTFNPTPPLPERARCQIIPPFVPAFKQPRSA